jgi:3-oxoacyl-[acyl-carrier protein] reductase
MKILISGATGAVGSALAKQLAKEPAAGHQLLLLARDAGKLAALTQAVGGVTQAADVLQPEGLQAAQEFIQQHGPVDAWAHCVGSTLIKPFHQVTQEQWQQQFDTNATSAFVLLKPLIQQALEHKQPFSAVLMSSVVAHAGFAHHEAIAAAKAAVTGLAISAATSYADRNIRVNVVAPGLTRSGMTARFVSTPEAEARSAALVPTGRIAEPEEVAGVIAFLLSPTAAHITGQVVRVDGGQGMLRPMPRVTAPSAKTA